MDLTDTPVFIERRRPQVTLNRVSGSGVSESIDRLVQNEWLAVAKAANAGSAHEYVLGDRFKRDDALMADWASLVARIHGKRGLFQSLGDVPLVARKKGPQPVINDSRALVLGALVSANRTPTMTELEEFLLPLI